MQCYEKNCVLYQTTVEFLLREESWSQFWRKSFPAKSFLPAAPAVAAASVLPNIHTAKVSLSNALKTLDNAQQLSLTSDLHCGGGQEIKIHMGIKYHIKISWILSARSLNRSLGRGKLLAGGLYLFL